MMGDFLIELQGVAERVAREAGALVQAQQHLSHKLQHKGFRDFATDADLAAQALIVGQLQEAFPTHGFVAEEDEEEGKLPAFGPIRWIIDPIDGTSNYSRHIPIYCISIGAVDETGDTVVGIIYDPNRDELFSSVRGGGSFVNGIPIQASPTTNLAQATVGFDWSRDPIGRQKVLDSVNTLAPQLHTMRAIGSAALAIAYVAAGRLDGYFNLGLKAWDAAAGALILREAGGCLSNLGGKHWTLADSGCVATNQGIKKALIRLLPT